MKKIALLSMVFLGVAGINAGYAVAAAECSLAHPENCAEFPTSEEIVGGCSDADVTNHKSPCTNPHSSKSRCENVLHNNVLRPSCVAKECADGYYLWYTTIKKGAYKGKKRSQGICYSKSYVENFCATKGNCGVGKRCVPNYIDIENDFSTKRNGGVWECVEEGGNNDGGNGKQCVRNITRAIICPNGDFRYDRDTYTVKNMTCEEFEAAYTTEQARWDAIVKDFCKDGGAGSEFDSAKARLDVFFQNAKQDKWKNEEGKFNAIRLASDLTAGVVLGTVGGVVSGVVIKKKQVEKGFDALHCTVGGQKVADWGDEFNVGLR